MKILVVFESMFGNSERVARAVAEGLEPFGDVVVRDVTSCLSGEIEPGVGLLVVGGPTHAFSMSRAHTREDAVRQGAGQGLVSRGLREWLSGLPDDLGLLPCAAFDTRISRARQLPGSAGRTAARALRRHKGRMVARPESFYVDDVAGPLGVDELDRARAWGGTLGHVLLDDHVEAG